MQLCKKQVKRLRIFPPRIDQKKATAYKFMAAARKQSCKVDITKRHNCEAK